jgi:hypothetical protein
MGKVRKRQTKSIPVQPYTKLLTADYTENTGKIIRDILDDFGRLFSSGSELIGLAPVLLLAGRRRGLPVVQKWREKTVTCNRQTAADCPLSSRHFTASSDCHEG